MIAGLDPGRFEFVGSGRWEGAVVCRRGYVYCGGCVSLLVEDPARRYGAVRCVSCSRVWWDDDPPPLDKFKAAPGNLVLGDDDAAALRAALDFFRLPLAADDGAEQLRMF